MAKPEIYVSIDIEADGPIPGCNSMLSLGAAAFVLDEAAPEGWRMHPDTFKVNLNPLPEATQDPDTMAWWARQPKAWVCATKDTKDPVEAMSSFVFWCSGLPGKPVLMGYPVTYDFMFVYWYTIRFATTKAPFGFQGLDLKTLAMDRMGCSFRGAAKRRMPQRWFKGAPAHTHDALDDAIGQGVMGMNILLSPSLR